MATFFGMAQVEEHLRQELGLNPDDPRIAELAQEVLRRSRDTIARKGIREDDERAAGSVFYNQARFAVIRERKARQRGRPPASRLSEQEADALVAQAFEAHHSELVRYCIRQLGDAGRAEELASDAFLDLREALLSGRVDGRKPTLPWLYSSAKNRILSAKAAKQSLPLFGEWVRPTWDESRDPSVVVLRQEQTERLRAALASIPAPAQQAILLLADGLPYPRIAEALGISWREARRLVEDARAQMRRALT
jgi:RNA polymerase sigma factor (sigma-70 family)